MGHCRNTLIIVATGLTMITLLASCIAPTTTPAEAVVAQEAEAAPAVEQASEVTAEESNAATDAAQPNADEAASADNPATPAEATTASSGRVDLDAIFPPGDGKNLVLFNCTSCHSFVPVVIVGFNNEEWDRNARDHYDRVSGMTDEERDILYAYLKEHFGPDDPVPDLPPALLEQWTSY